MIRISGLWLHNMQDGSKKLTGNLGNGRIIIIPNKNKHSDGDADYIMYLAEKETQPKDDTQGIL